jgi:hypothetical protein
MKYAVEMGLGAITFLTKFKKCVQPFEGSEGECSCTDTRDGGLMILSVCSFENRTSKLKLNSPISLAATL